jgi:hypothetical protein
LPLPVYSTRFQAYQGLNGNGPTITVPAGHTYVVKQLTCYMDPSLGVIRAFFRDLLSGATEFSCATTLLAPEWFGFFGTIVFEEGQDFRWEVSATLTDGADVSIHGFDLTN